jgi:hypothetical protein
MSLVSLDPLGSGPRHGPSASSQRCLCCSIDGSHPARGHHLRLQPPQIPQMENPECLLEPCPTRRSSPSLLPPDLAFCSLVDLLRDSRLFLYRTTAPFPIL